MICKKNAARIFSIGIICIILGACAVARAPSESEGGIGGTGNQDSCATPSDSKSDNCDQESIP